MYFFRVNSLSKDFHQMCIFYLIPPIPFGCLWMCEHRLGSGTKRWRMLFASNQCALAAAELPFCCIAAPSNREAHTVHKAANHHWGDGAGRRLEREYSGNFQRLWHFSSTRLWLLSCRWKWLSSPSINETKGQRRRKTNFVTHKVNFFFSAADASLNVWCAAYWHLYIFIE